MVRVAVRLRDDGWQMRCHEPERGGYPQLVCFVDLNVKKKKKNDGEIDDLVHLGHGMKAEGVAVINAKRYILTDSAKPRNDLMQWRDGSSKRLDMHKDDVGDLLAENHILGRFFWIHRENHGMTRPATFESDDKCQTP